jgi:phage terminase large subunit-like protein
VSQAVAPVDVDVLLPPLHPGQRAVAEHRARFRVVVAGRRWGKTRLGAVLCFAEMLLGKRVWWLAPTYAQATVAWRDLTRLARVCDQQRLPIVIRLGDLLVQAPTGGWVQVRSADDPDRLRGEGLDFVVFDEAATIPENTWTEVIRPALADRKGRALFIGTPRGRNWFWKLVQDAQRDPAQWQVWQVPTVGHPLSNPFIDPNEIEAARRSLPERVFRQEFLAEFVEDGGGIFRNVRSQAIAERQERPQPGHVYVIGVDWGKFEDFSVFLVLDATNRMVADVVRLRQIDYTTQMQQLIALVHHWRPLTIVAERNAMGEPLVEQLLQRGLPVQPVQVHAGVKHALVDALALALEQEQLFLPGWSEASWLIDELEAFTAERLPSGLLRYTAPPGQHDDGVMALALAWSAASSTPPPAYGPTIWGW